MPWNNNSGGGGWKGGGGPWGQGPQQRGPQPPDLEELLKRSQDRLRSFLPSGGRNNGSVLVLAAVALVAFWLFQCIYTVQPDELGQELVFGRPKVQVSNPGLHFHFWPVETVEKVNIRQQQETIGGDNSPRTADSNLMLSSDQNIVAVNFSVLWRVSDPKAFLFNVSDPAAFVRRVAESAMREFVGRSRAEDIPTTQRAEVAETVRGIVQGTLDSYKSGITVVGVQFGQADPPAEVADAFEEVQRAQQDQDRFQREADQYANRRLGDARGQAAQIREQALGYKEQVVQEAQGEAQRFTSVLQQYSQAPEVTRKRLYLETIERVLSGSNKIVLDSGAGANVMQYLPLNDILRPRPTAGTSARPLPQPGGAPAPTQLPVQGAAQ